MLLTDDEINVRLQEVSTSVRVALDADPLINGLTGLNAKLAEIQLSKDRISFLLTEALRNSNLAEIDVEKATHAYEQEMNYLLATDATVQSQKSSEQRQAFAKTKMSDKVINLHHAEIEKIKADSYLKGLQSIMSNLESTNANLSRQITVLQLSNNIGELGRKA